MNGTHVLQGKRILVVDDEASIRKVVAKRLEGWGCEVLAVEDGESGLKIASEKQPDLILLDTLMPRMKGREVLSALKGDPRTAQIPVIFLTALRMPDHIKAGLDLGAEDYIVKPFDRHELRRRIQVCLLRHGAKDEG